MRRLFLFGLLLSASFVRAQNPVDPTNITAVPPAPETWAFTRYGEYPVSRETGVPEISIPLHTVSSGDLSVPITLSYHASGIKVDEKAGTVGLGWNLSYGGIISRIVKGYPDERPLGYLVAGIPTAADLQPYHDDDYSKIQQIIASEADSQPDEFYFEVPGASAKFFFGPDGKAYTQPFSNVLIEKTNTSHDITSFTITTPDGVKYYFAEPAVTSYQTNFNLLSVQANTTWYLKEITSANSTDRIRFYYRQKGDYTPTRYVASDYLNFQYVDGLYSGYIKERRLGEIDYTFNVVKEIDSIATDEVRVAFNYSNRLDENDVKLDLIDIYGPDKKTIFKGFNFAYSYFTTTVGTNTYRKLKLTSVQERGLMAETINPYEFTYDEALALPPRYSFSQDYWGYYNGKSNGSYLPEYTYIGPTGEKIKMGDADRSTVENPMKAGIIKTITYPTRGYTQFEFEANDIPYTYTSVIPFRYEVGIYPDITTSHETPIPASGTLLQDKSAYLTYQINLLTGTINYNDMSVQLKNITTGQTVFEHKSVTSNMKTTPATLLAGNAYKIFVFSNLNQTSNRGIATISVSWEEEGSVITENKKVGGLRVKAIKSYDESNILQTQKSYVYRKPDAPTISSGRYNTNWLPTPNAFVQQKERRYAAAIGSPPECQTYKDLTVSLSANATHQQVFSAGAPVTYEYVTEYKTIPSDNTYGRSVYKYEVGVDELVGNPFHVFNIDKTFLRGQLLKEEHFDKNTTDPVQTVSYFYEVVDNLQIIGGAIIGEVWSIAANTPCVSCDTYPYCDEPTILSQRAERVKFFPYYHRIAWKRLSSVVETTNGVQITKTFSYNIDKKHTNVVSASTTRSDGKSERVDIKYAHDVTENTLIAKNIVDMPLQSDNYVNNNLIAGNKVTYATMKGNYVPFKYEQRLQDGSYLLRGEIVEADAKERPIIVKHRDGVNNLFLWDERGDAPLCQMKSNNVAVSSLTISLNNNATAANETVLREFYVPFAQSSTVTGSVADPYTLIPSNNFSFTVVKQGGSNPVVNVVAAGSFSFNIFFTPGKYLVKTKISSSTSKQISTSIQLPLRTMDVFYTGFEGTKEGDVSLAKAGASGRQNFKITLDGLVNGKKYLLSYWQHDGSKWNFVSTPLATTTGTYTIDLTGTIDEIRFAPEGLQMLTYSYDPVNPEWLRAVGDVNNNFQYFEFDNMGRASVLRDTDYKILRTMQYQFKTPN
jgi:hypothetical protein